MKTINRECLGCRQRAEHEVGSDRCISCTNAAVRRPQVWDKGSNRWRDVAPIDRAAVRRGC